MTINVPLSHEQIATLLADACGANPDDVTLSASPHDRDPSILIVSASIKTDMDGGKKIARVLSKHGVQS